MRLTHHRLLGIAGIAVALIVSATTIAGAACDPKTTCLKVPTAAPPSIGLQVSPVLIDAKMRPNQTIVKEITLRSLGTTPLTVEFQHADFGFTKKTYQRVYIEDKQKQTGRFTTRGWFSITVPKQPGKKKANPDQSFTVPPGQAVVIPLTIHAPADAGPGTHMGAAFFVTHSPTPQGTTTRVRTSARTGPLVFVAISGGKTAKPTVKDFSVPHFPTRGPIKPKVVLDNGGDVHFRFSGTVKLSGRGHTYTDKLSHKFVLPHLPRTLQATDETPLSLGTRHLPMGLYTVKLDLTVAPGTQRLTTTRHILILPWKVRFVILGVLVAIALFFAFGWRRFSEWRYQRLVRLAAFEEDDDVSDETDS